MKPKTLQSQLRDVALEYMRKVADLLGRDPRECHWVGTDDHERGIYTICDLGDITFLTLDQMQVIIDRLPEWLARYGSREAVAQEIDDWMEWSIQEENWLDGHPCINLEHWLMGCPREQKGIETGYVTGEQLRKVCGLVDPEDEKRLMEKMKEIDPEACDLLEKFLEGEA